MIEALESMLLPALPVALRNPVNRHHPLNRGRVAWWLSLPGWMGGRQWFDLFGLNPATLTGMGNASNGWRATTRPGGWGHMAFDNSGQVLTATSAPWQITTVSVACWFATTSTGYMRIVTTSAGSNIPWSLEMLSGDPLFNLFDGSNNPYIQSGTAFNDGLWHRMLGTRILAGSLRLYVDGKQVASGNDGTTFSTTNGNVLSLGANISGGQNFVGSLDSVTVWNRALSAAEVKADYDLSRRGYPGVLNRVPLWSYSIPAGGGGSYAWWAQQRGGALGSGLAA